MLYDFMFSEQSPSKSIEMNGYRMMAYLYLYDTETNNEKKATMLKKIDTLKEWLLSKRRGNGLFESTQVLQKFSPICCFI
jgi:hypothetical protein